MIVYFLLLFICLMSLLIYNHTKNKFYKVLPYLLMTFVCGFRGNVGVDTKNYVEFFTKIVSGQVSFEVGYDFLVKLVAYMGGTQQFIFLIMSGLTSFFIYKFIDEMKENFEISTIIYLCIGPFYFSSYNTIREALVVSVFLYSLRFLGDEPKYLKFILCILGASLFHSTVLLWLVYPLYKMISKRISTYIIVGVGILLAYIIEKNGVIDYVIIHYLRQYGNYVQRAQQMDGSYILFCFIAIIIIIAATNKWIIIDQKYLDMTVIAAFLIAFPLITNAHTMLFTRLASYVTPVFIVVVPQFKRMLKQKWLFNSALIIFCMGYYILLVSTNEDMKNYLFSFQLFN